MAPTLPIVPTRSRIERPLKHPRTRTDCVLEGGVDAGCGVLWATTASAVTSSGAKEIVMITTGSDHILARALIVPPYCDSLCVK